MTQGNFFEKPFGMNIKLPTRTIQQGKETAENAVGSVLEPLFTYIDENQPVFTGNVANEIEKYNLISYNIGAALRKDKVTGDFDVKG